MKVWARLFLALSVLVFWAGTSEAYSRRDEGVRQDDFLGTWQNVNIRETQVTRIIIRRIECCDVEVRVFGLYHGRPVDFGFSRGRLFRAAYPRERGQDDAAILVRVDREYVRGNVLIRFNGRGEIVSHALLTFRDERGDVYSVERFAPAEVDGDDCGGRYPRRDSHRCGDRDYDAHQDR